MIQASVAQIRSVESTVGESAKIVDKLGKRSQEIGQIVETISGIAGQTNLLALNAAIEAARAASIAAFRASRLVWPAMPEIVSTI